MQKKHRFIYIRYNSVFLFSINLYNILCHDELYTAFYNRNKFFHINVRLKDKEKFIFLNILILVTYNFCNSTTLPYCVFFTITQKLCSFNIFIYCFLKAPL